MYSRKSDTRVYVPQSTEKDLNALGFHIVDATQLSITNLFLYSLTNKIIVTFGAETANLIFTDHASVYLLVDSRKMIEPLYLNALTDILAISNSRLSIIPLESDGDTNSSGLGDSKLTLPSVDFL